MNIENRVIFYLVFFIVMQVITLLSRKILWNSVCKAGGTTPEGVREKKRRAFATIYRQTKLAKQFSCVDEK